MRLQPPIVALALMAGLVLAARAEAADSPARANEMAVLKLAPADALGVLVVNHLDVAMQKSEFLLQEMHSPATDMMESLRIKTGVQHGVDEHGAFGLALLPNQKAGEAPLNIAFLPVTDYEKLLADLEVKDAKAEIAEGKFFHLPALIGHKNGYAVIADAEKFKDQAEQALKKILAGGKGIDDVAAPVAQWIGEHEVSFVVSSAGIKAGAAGVRKQLAQLKETMLKAPQANVAASGLGFYEELIKGAENEFELMAIGARVDDDGGLRFDNRMLFRGNGTLAKAGAEAQPVAGPRLTQLPGGPYFIAFEGSIRGSLSKNFLNISADAVKSMVKQSSGKDLTDEQMKQLNNVFEHSWSAAGVTSMVMGTPKPGESIYNRVYGTIKVKDAAAFLTAYEKSIQDVNTLYKSFDVPLLKPMAIEKTTFDGKPVLQLTMDLASMMKAVAQTPSRKMMDSMFGPDGKLRFFMAALDETTVGIAYNSVDNLKALDEVRKNPQTSLSADRDLQQTVKLLPEGAQWIAFVSPKGLMDFSMAMVLGAMPQGMLPQLPSFPQTPPVGFAALLNASSIDAHLVIPGAVFRGIGQYVQQMQRNFAPQPQPGLPPQIQ